MMRIFSTAVFLLSFFVSCNAFAAGSFDPANPLFPLYDDPLRQSLVREFSEFLSGRTDASQFVAKLRVLADRPLTHEELIALSRNWDSKFLWDNSKATDIKRVCDGAPEVINDHRRDMWCEALANKFGEIHDWLGALAYDAKGCSADSIAFGSSGDCGDAYDHFFGIVHDEARTRRFMRKLYETCVGSFDCETNAALYYICSSIICTESDDPTDRSLAAKYEKMACENHEYAVVSPRSTKRACQQATRFGAQVDLEREVSLQSELNTQYVAGVKEQDEREHEERVRRNAEIAQQMANNAAMVNAITHNGNLIAETANRQTAAVLAIGNASAVRAIPPVAQRQTSQPPTARNASSSQSSNGASSNPGMPRNVASANDTAGTSPASNPDQYTDALSNTCVGHFWDPKFYGWWSFQNNCGQAIHLQFFAANGAGVFGGGGAADIAAGGSTNIGQSPAEVSAAGGGYVVYVCPAGYVAVDGTGRIVSGRGQSYRCKKW